MTSHILLKPAERDVFDNDESYNKYKEIVDRRIDNLLGYFNQVHPGCAKKSDFRAKACEIWNKFAVVISEKYRENDHEFTAAEKAKFTVINFFFSGLCQQYTRLCNTTGTKGSLGYHIQPRIIVDFKGDEHKIYEDQLLYDAIMKFLEFDPAISPGTLKTFRQEFQDLIDNTERDDLSPPLAQNVEDQIESIKFLGTCGDEKLFLAAVENIELKKENAHLTSTVEHMKKLFDRLVNEIENIVTRSVWEHFSKLFKPLIPENATQEQETAVNKIVNETLEETINELSKYFSEPLREHVKDVVESSGSFDYVQSSLIAELKVKIADLNAEMNARDEQYSTVHEQFVSDKSVFAKTVETHEQTIGLNRKEIAWLKNRAEHYKERYTKLFDEIAPMKAKLKALRSEKQELSSARKILQKLGENGVPKLQLISKEDSDYESRASTYGSSPSFEGSEEYTSADEDIFKEMEEEEKEKTEVGSQSENADPYKAKTPPGSPVKIGQGGVG